METHEQMFFVLDWKRCSGICSDHQAKIKTIELQTRNTKHAYGKDGEQYYVYVCVNNMQYFQSNNCRSVTICRISSEITYQYSIIIIRQHSFIIDYMNCV